MKSGREGFGREVVYSLSPSPTVILTLPQKRKDLVYSVIPAKAGIQVGFGVVVSLPLS
jgi:hypothetical protein